MLKNAIEREQLILLELPSVSILGEANNPIKRGQSANEFALCRA